MQVGKTLPCVTPFFQEETYLFQEGGRNLISSVLYQKKLAEMEETLLMVHHTRLSGKKLHVLSISSLANMFATFVMQFLV